MRYFTKVKRNLWFPLLVHVLTYRCFHLRQFRFNLYLFSKQQKKHTKEFYFNTMLMPVPYYIISVDSKKGFITIGESSVRYAYSFPG